MTSPLQLLLNIGTTTVALPPAGAPRDITQRRLRPRLERLGLTDAPRGADGAKIPVGVRRRSRGLAGQWHQAGCGPLPQHSP